MTVGKTSDNSVIFIQLEEPDTNAKRPPAEALRACQKAYPSKTLEKIEAILWDQMQQPHGGATYSLISLFAIAYEWGRINGKKSRKRRSKD